MDLTATLDLADTGPPLEIPGWIHAVLWPVLIVWVVALRSASRRHRALRSAALGFALAVLCLGVDSATVAATFTRPGPAADPFVLALLWLAALLSVSAYLVLRAPGDDGGGGPEADVPEPPWWPEFERRFRDYARGKPRAPSRRPRAPTSRS